MINVKKRKITLAQAGIFLWAIALGAAAVLFLVFVYGPAQHQLLEARRKAFFVEGQTKWLEEITAVNKNPEEAIRQLMLVHKTLGRQFREDSARSLLLLAAYANNFRIRMAEIRPEEPELFTDRWGDPVMIDGKKCVFVYTQMNFKADYVNLVKYLDALHQVLPAYMTVDRLEIESQPTATPQLNVKAWISLYFLEP